MKDDRKQHDIRHLYLYAKGHYVRTNIVEDLKIIVGRITWVYPEHTDKGDILYWLTKEAYKHMKNGHDGFFDFISIFFPENQFYVNEGDDSIDMIIKKCLSILSLTKVCDIDIVLGEADRNILPLIKEIQNEQIA